MQFRCKFSFTTDLLTRREAESLVSLQVFDFKNDGARRVSRSLPLLSRLTTDANVLFLAFKRCTSAYSEHRALSTSYSTDFCTVDDIEIPQHGKQNGEEFAQLCSRESLASFLLKSIAHLNSFYSRIPIGNLETKRSLCSSRKCFPIILPPQQFTFLINSIRLPPL